MEEYFFRYLRLGEIIAKQQAKLSFLVEEWCTSDEKEKQALEEFHLVVGTNLYLKRYEVSCYFSGEVKSVEVTPNEWEAKTCTPADEMKLKRHGFKRKKIDLSVE